ncbi:MAG: ABC transporter ATP-binding protein [Candidatus Omnitrophica bacterium]|nr:ABC transporter ATP-binding protein [Candidatus Omnitrophota bacterium]
MENTFYTAYTMNTLLDIVAVTKIYDAGASAQGAVAALREVTLAIPEGDYCSIVGPSGAGKSTLLHMMGGLDEPTHGTIFFRGSDIHAMGERALARWRNRTIGFVFQFYHLIEELDVLENIAIAAHSMKRKSSSKRAQELLEYLGIIERRDFFPSQLSGGEKQKVAIARALVNNPDIILCDEPTGNLDIDSQNKVMHLLETLHHDKKKALVLITHNLELARRAHRIVRLAGGIITQ